MGKSIVYKINHSHFCTGRPPDEIDFSYHFLAEFAWIETFGISKQISVSTLKLSTPHTQKEVCTVQYSLRIRKSRRARNRFLTDPSSIQRKDSF